MLVGGFEKYTISRSLVNPTDRTGQRREVDALVGFLQKHKCLGHFQKKCSSHNCHEIFVPFLTIGVFFRCQYFVRPLFEIFEQEWIPWFELHVVEVYLVALSNKVAEIHVVMSCVTANKPSDLWQQPVGCDKLCHKWGQKEIFVTTFKPFWPLCVKDLWMLMSFWGFWYNKCVWLCVCVHDQKWCLRRFFCQYESA